MSRMGLALGGVMGGGLATWECWGRRGCEGAEDLRVWVGHLGGGGRLSVVRSGSGSESMKSSLDSG